MIITVHLDSEYMIELLMSEVEKRIQDCELLDLYKEMYEKRVYSSEWECDTFDHLEIVKHDTEERCYMVDSEYILQDDEVEESNNGIHKLIGLWG